MPASRRRARRLVTPGAGRYAAHVVERDIAVYRRRLDHLVSGFFEPFFYLLSIGVGSASSSGPSRRRLVIAYTAFVAPGLLASSAMNGAMIDSTFLVFLKLKISKTYDAMLSTPLGRR